MTANELLALVSGIGALVVSAFALFQRAAESRRNSRVLEAANVVTGYSQLCDDLQKQININNAEIERLKRELTELRQQSQVDREAWERERADLQLQITELQRENKRLREELLAEINKRGGG